MARDYKPKAEATVRAELRSLRKLADHPDASVIERARAEGALAALEWARGASKVTPVAAIMRATGAGE
jgi:hypothetical protein